MPCRECGESAKKHGGLCVGLEYDDSGEATYTCLDCTIEELEASLEEN